MIEGVQQSCDQNVLGVGAMEGMFVLAGGDERL